MLTSTIHYAGSQLDLATLGCDLSEACDAIHAKIDGCEMFPGQREAACPLFYPLTREVLAAYIAYRIAASVDMHAWLVYSEADRSDYHTSDGYYMEYTYVRAQVDYARERFLSIAAPDGAILPPVYADPY